MTTAIHIAREQLRQNEGLRLKPYRCTAGKLTLGYGRNLDDVGIILPEAEMMLENDISRAVAGLDKNILWWRSLDAVRGAVLVNMAFQLGLGGLLEFRKFLTSVKVGNWEEAATEMLDSKGAKTDSPQRAYRLSVKMREGE